MCLLDSLLSDVCFFSGEFNDFVGTLNYMAPEVITVLYFCSSICLSVSVLLCVCVMHSLALQKIKKSAYLCESF